MIFMGKMMITYYHLDMKQALTIVLTIIILLASCGNIPGNTTIPDWMLGEWEMYDNGNYIGICNIKKGQIEIQDNFDLLEYVYQRGGWTNATDITYTLYLSYDAYMTFEYVSNDSLIFTASRDDSSLTLIRID